MKVWVVFEGDFLCVGEYYEWTWNFYGIYDSEAKAKEVVDFLERKKTAFDSVEYKIEEHFVK